jgi:hypothetical protein
LQVSVVCNLSNEAKTSLQESSSHGSGRVEEELDMDTRWVILINELPQSSLDDDASLHLDQAFVLKWSTYDDFRYKGHASLSFLIPLEDSATVDERTVIVTLMENSSDGHPRITSRRLANLPFSPSHSNPKNARTNMVVNVELSGSTTCAYDYKTHVLREGTRPQSSGAAGWAMALVACIVAYAFPKESPHSVPRDEAPNNVVASLSSTRLHLPEIPRVENDGTIESTGHVSVGSVGENESLLRRRDDSTDSNASTPGSGPRIERPPQLVRIPCAFIFTEDEESVACHNEDENRHAFPSPDVAEPKPGSDELSENQTDSRAMTIAESVVDSRETSMVVAEDVGNQEAGGGESGAHSVGKRRIHEGNGDIVANGIDSQELPNIVHKDEKVDKDLSKDAVGNSEQEDRFVDDRQTIQEVPVDVTEPLKTPKNTVQDMSKCEKHQQVPDVSSVANVNTDQRTGDVVVDASEPHTTTRLTENPVGSRRSKVMDLEYLPVAEQSNWLQRLRKRPANKIASSVIFPSSSVAEEEDCHAIDQGTVETVTDMGFVTVDDDDHDGTSDDRASGGVSYVSTLPADSDTTCSPMNEWPQTDLDAAMDFSRTVDGELESEPTRDDSRPLKRKRRFDPFKSHRTNDELLQSASIHTQATRPVETSSRKQAFATKELSCVAAHQQEVDAVPTSQTVAKKASRIKKELKRSKTPALLPDVVPSSFLQSFCTQQIDAPVPWDFTLSTSAPKGGTIQRQRDNGKRRKGPPTTIEILGDSPRSRQPTKKGQHAVSRDSSMTSRGNSNGAHKPKKPPAAGKRRRLA